MRMKSEDPDNYNSQGAYLFGSAMKDKNGYSQSLEGIQEDSSRYLPSPTSYPPPETPQEPMEFLSRAWKIPAVDVAKALAPGLQVNNTLKLARDRDQSSEHSGLETTPFTFASAMTSKMVMDRILTPMEHSVLQPRRNTNSNSLLIAHNSDHLTASPPPSPSLANGLQYCKIIPSLRLPFQGRSVRKWLKDLRDRKKENTRVHNAQIHAAVCVSAVAAAIAAVAAATASSAIDDGGTKTSIAVASAASLVAAHCVELAENMGADSQQVAAVVSSAVSVKTSGDVMTLTAAAATALRGASTLEARNSKERRIHNIVAPSQRARNYSDGLSINIVSEDSEAEFYTQELLAKGCEFLKRSKAGELSWRFVYIFLDKHGQVVVKLQSKHVGGALKKTEKSVIIDLYPEIPAWPGRNPLENGEQQRYFGIRTNRGVTEFECRSVYLHKLWTQGISHLLLLAHQQ